MASGIETRVTDVFGTMFQWINWEGNTEMCAPISIYFSLQRFRLFSQLKFDFIRFYNHHQFLLALQVAY